jgi:hypothetical protein
MRRHPYIAFALAFFLAPLLFGVVVMGVLALVRILDLRSPVPELILFLCRTLYILGTAALSLLALRRVVGDLCPPRAAIWTVRAAALAFAAFLVHGFASGDALGFTYFCIQQYVAGCIVWAFCTAVFGIAIFLRKRNWRVVPGRFRVAAGFLVVCVLAALLYEWFVHSPFREGYRSETVGDPPRESVFSRAWFGWNIGYDVRLYVRRDDGRWDVWLFDVFPDSAENATVEILPDGKPAIHPDTDESFLFFGQRPFPNAPFVPWKPSSGDPDYPAALSPADLHAVHRALCKKPGFGFLPPAIPKVEVGNPDKAEPVELILLGAGREALDCVPEAIRGP